MNDARLELIDYIQTLKGEGYEVLIKEFENYYDLKVVTPDDKKLIVSVYGHDRFEPEVIRPKLESIIEFLKENDDDEITD